jgi:hypothetical protein
MHDIAGVGITVATILAATLFSSQTINDLRFEIMGRLDATQQDMREFYAEQAPRCPHCRT